MTELEKALYNELEDDYYPVKELPEGFAVTIGDDKENLYLFKETEFSLLGITFPLDGNVSLMGTVQNLREFVERNYSCEEELRLYNY